MIIHLLLIVLACVVIWRASDGFEAASEYLGRNMTDGVRGATINAIGSSMPELFTTFFFLFALHDKDGFAGGIGTTAGSAIFNGMIIPAVVILAVIGYGLAKNVNVSKKVIWRDGLSLILAEVVLIFLITGDSLHWWHGLLLMATYGLYVLVMLTSMTGKKESSIDESIEEENEEKGERSFLNALLTLDLKSLIVKDYINKGNAWILLLVSMSIIGASCALLVNGCEHLAEGLGIHTYFIAVILASAATSVPDTIISFRDAMNGEYDDAVANALGSNIFDVCFALGFPLFIYTILYGPISMNQETLANITELRVFLLISTFIAFLIYALGKSLDRKKAYLLLGIYIIFALFIGTKAYNVPEAVEFGEFLRSII